MHRALKRLLYATSLFFISMSVGAMGYMLLEGYNWVDATYMAVITFSTVGFTEVNPLSMNGKLFTACYIIVNLGIFAYTVSVLSTFLFEGELQKVFQKYKTNREVNKMKNHVIVCGCGRNGTMACEELFKEKMPFVIVENDEKVIESLPQKFGNALVYGNATLDETLIEAGVKVARTIITTLPNDADNVFISLTAKELNPGIEVISKASDARSEMKLYRAGVSHVVMPDRLGGMHMANLITKPFVIEFLEMLNGVGSSHHILEEVSHDTFRSEFKGRTLKELDIRSKTGVTVVAFKEGQQGFIFNPHPDKRVKEGDVLIILGQNEELVQFRKQYM